MGSEEYSSTSFKVVLIFFFLPLGFVILKFICKAQDSTLNKTFLLCFVLDFQTDLSVGSSAFPLSAMAVNNGFEIS